MPIQHIVNGEVLHELSLTEFKAGLFQLSGENQSVYIQLLKEFEKRALEEVIQTAEGKKLGKSEAQIIFERLQRSECRKHQAKLNKNMLAAGHTKFSKTNAHHIVAWNDKRAQEARAILSQFGIDIDSAANGVILPSNKKDIPHPKLPEAYAHRTIHTKIYYINITSMLRRTTQLKNTTQEDIIATLQEIAQDLQQGTFPLYKRVGRR